LSAAIASGLSGAILVVTPQVGDSRIIRDVELPEIFKQRATPAFTFSVASTIADPLDSSRADLAAPDRLLGPLPIPLSRFDIALVDSAAARSRLARRMAVDRLQGLRPDVAANGGSLTIDLQSRVPPIANQADSHLVIRLRPPIAGTEVPNPAGLVDLQGLLEWLPELVAHSGAECIEIKGGAHLTACLAIGAALPTTVFSEVAVTSTAGGRWSLTGQAPLNSTRRLIERLPAEGEWAQPTGGRGRVAVFVDLLPASNPWPFRDLVAGQEFAGIAHLRPATEGLLQAEDAADLVGQIAHEIRLLSNSCGTAEVHLAYAGPFPVAILLGRALNTLVVHGYELATAADEPGAPQRYVPTVVIQAGVGGGPLRWVSGQPPLGG
jgi:hypothetical protein